MAREVVLQQIRLGLTGAVTLFVSPRAKTEVMLSVDLDRYRPNHEEFDRDIPEAELHSEHHGLIPVTGTDFPQAAERGEALMRAVGNLKKAYAFFRGPRGKAAKAFRLSYNKERKGLKNVDPAKYLIQDSKGKKHKPLVANLA